MDEKTEKVLNVFNQSENPLRPGEISEITGIESKELSKIIDKLKKEGIIDSPKRCFYALKK